MPQVDNLTYLPTLFWLITNFFFGFIIISYLQVNNLLLKKKKFIYVIYLKRKIIKFLIH